ncbi:MAG: DUF1326 domain-containing protein [Gammaproteobacteria bacterium]
MNKIPTWWLKGNWFDVCSCNIACPCEFAQPATNGHCEALLAWHIREGEYGAIDLAGFNLVGLSSFDGNVWDNPDDWEMGLFIDERADDAQREALVAIWSGQAGGWMKNFSELIAKDRGIEFAPIEFEIADNLAYWRAEIPGLVEARAEALGGPTTPEGELVQMTNPPGSEVGPGGPATWAKATRNSVNALGFNWEWSGQSSKHIPFDWIGP